MTKVKSLYFTKYKSGILELVFQFDSKNSCGHNLFSSDCLVYSDLSGEQKVFNFPKSIYQGCDLRNYIQYECTDKDQFVIVFIPQEMLIGGNDPSEVIEYEEEFIPD